MAKDIASQLVESLRNNPDSWTANNALSLEHGSGIELRWGKPFEDGSICTALLIRPRRVEFSWWQKRRLIRAVKAWFARPLTELEGK